MNINLKNTFFVFYIKGLKKMHLYSYKYTYVRAFVFVDNLCWCAHILTKQKCTYGHKHLIYSHSKVTYI